MLMLVLALCVVVSCHTVLRRKDSASLCLLGMSVSNCVMLAGVIIYIAKMGGMAAYNQTLLFLVPRLQTWLQFLPLSMDTLGFFTAAGRTLFPLLALYAAMELTSVRAVRCRVRLLYPMAAVLPSITLVCYWPGVFRALIHGRFWLMKPMIDFAIGWILCYLTAALVLLAYEYRSLSVRPFKSHARHLLLSVGSICVLYLCYAVKDPAQIYNMFITEYIRLGISSYISPSTSFVQWVALGLCTVFFVGFGSYHMMKYTKISLSRHQHEFMMECKFRTAGMGVSVFVHSIKNQLLASRVLHKRLAGALERRPPDWQQARHCAQQLHEMNENMLGRLGELYRSVRTNSLTLTAVSMDGVLYAAAQRFYEKHPEGLLAVQTPPGCYVLADKEHLSEAFSNLICNGYEAGLQSGAGPRCVLVRAYVKRLWVAVEVRDWGGGISAEVQGKMFDPFFTSKNTNYNWGMGLYYVRKIVKEHFGRLKVEARCGEGSSFWVLLPSLCKASRKGAECE